MEPKYDDCYMLSFTSGTTGYPKGVKLTHKMMMNCITSINLHFGEFRFTEQDTYISYLPYAHIFEQVLYGQSIIFGMKMGYYSGDVLKIVAEDLPILKPTFFPGVPRLFNRLYGVL